MKKTDNIYIDALRFGVLKMDQGVSLNELTDHLKQIGWEVNDDFIKYYHFWFFTHFYDGEHYNALKNGNPHQVYDAMRSIHTHFHIKFPMTSEAFEIYQDFVKIQQAKVDSQKAINIASKSNRYAFVAMVIASIVGLLQIFLQFISLCKE
jgi:hypothetical protein